MSNIFLRICRRALAVSAYLVYSFQAGAQAKQLSLFDAVSKAQAYYPLIQQREAELNASAAHITTVEGNRLPILKLHDQVSFGTANSLTGPFFPLGLVVPTAGAIRSENNYTLASGSLATAYLEWELYNFGLYKADRKNAEASFNLKTAILNNDKYTIAQMVLSLYLELLKDHQAVDIEKKNVERNETIFTAIRANVVSGLKPGVDSTTAMAEYSRARISYLQALNRYTEDLFALAAYTGLDTAAIVPDTTLFEKMLQYSKMHPFDDDTINNGHPLLKVYENQYELQLASNKVDAKKYLPKVYMVGAASMRGSSISSADVYSPDLMSGLGFGRNNYVIGGAITYNIFDLKHRRDVLREGEYTAQAKKYEFDNNRLVLSRILAQTKASYDNTRQQLKEIPLQVDASMQAYSQQKALYDAGLNTLVDVTNALYSLNQAETNYIIAQNAFLKLLSIRAGIDNQLDNFLQNFK